MKNLMKVRRWEANLKQYELANLLDCSAPFLSMVENGRIDPPEDFKKRAARALNCRVGDLFPKNPKSRSLLR